VGLREIEGRPQFRVPLEYKGKQADLQRAASWERWLCRSLKTKSKQPADPRDPAGCLRFVD
jgi:hypothetical protein